MTDEDYTAVAWTGISKAVWDRLESGGQLPSRALDNYMRMILAGWEPNPPDLRRVNSRFGGKRVVKVGEDQIIDYSEFVSNGSDSEEVTIELTKRYDMPR